MFPEAPAFGLECPRFGQHPDLLPGSWTETCETRGVAKQVRTRPADGLLLGPAHALETDCGNMT